MENVVKECAHDSFLNILYLEQFNESKALVVWEFEMGDWIWFCGWGSN